MLLLYVYRLCAYLAVGNNLCGCGYKVVFSMTMSCFYFPQRRCLICQRNTHCDEAISINRSINLIIDYFSNRLIVAALVWIEEVLNYMLLLLLLLLISIFVLPSHFSIAIPG